jgi:hypothetical protein
MADTDKHPAKPSPEPTDPKTEKVKKEGEQPLTDTDLDQVSGGIDGSAAWTASGVRKR